MMLDFLTFKDCDMGLSFQSVQISQPEFRSYMNEWSQCSHPFGYDDAVDVENVVIALYLFPDTPVHPVQLKEYGPQGTFLLMKQSPITSFSMHHFYALCFIMFLNYVEFKDSYF